MRRQAAPIELDAVPELRPLVEAVRRSGKPCIIRTGGEEVARIVPAAAKRRRRGTPISSHDPMWAIIGIDASLEGPTDVSEHEQHYLNGPPPAPVDG